MNIHQDPAVKAAFDRLYLAAIWRANQMVPSEAYMVASAKMRQAERLVISTILASVALANQEDTD